MFNARLENCFTILTVVNFIFCLTLDKNDIIYLFFVLTIKLRRKR